MRIRQTARTIVAVALGALPLVACGSDRAGVTTAPSSVPGAATSIGLSSVPGGSFTALNHPSDPTARLSGETTVTSLVTGTACPTLAFMMGTYKIAVTAATEYVGGSCADITAGARLRVTGTKQADDSILALSIEVKSAPPARNVEGEGVITGLKAGTACPELTFLVESKQVLVTASTTIEGGVCADLRIGLRVHVKGAYNDEGDVVATSVQIQSVSPGFPVVEGQGRVSSLVAGTACPALQFMIEGYTVTLDTSTAFTNGTCSGIAIGQRLGVKGTVTGDHAVLATRIIFKADDDS